jgi:hypothetical protein
MIPGDQGGGGCQYQLVNISKNPYISAFAPGQVRYVKPVAIIRL